MDPLILLAVIGMMGVAASLTFAVWRTVTRPADGDAFDEALAAIEQGDSIDSHDMALTVDKPDSWNWFTWWNVAVLRSGREVTDPHSFGRVMLGAIAVAAFFGMFVYPGSGLANPLMTMLGAVVVPSVVVLFVRGWLNLEIRKRRTAMDRQLPLFLSSMRAQIHSGQTLQSSFMEISVDFPAPLGDELRQVRDEVNVSVPLETALLDMSSRVGSRLLQFLVSSLGIALRSGSDVVPQLTTIEDIVRQRARIAGKIRSAIALAKPTAYLAMAAPPFMALYMTFTSEGYIAYFFGEGLLSLLLAVVLYGLGAFLLKVIVSNVEKI